jgi:hypothetical protein
LKTYSYRKTIQLIADILSFEHSKTALENSLGNPSCDWDALVMEGSKQLVLPALYCRLKAKQLLHLLPEDLETYLADITQINRNRNQAILEQVQDISKLLNSHDIEHVFLKGTALLALGCYADQAKRMVGDIDILVQPSQVHMAFDLLKSNGYDQTFGFAYENKEFRHLDRLIAEDKLAAIELHTELLNKNHRALIDALSLLNSSRISNGIKVPDPYYLSKHLLLAWQLNDKGHVYKVPNLKSLYDLIVLNAHKDAYFISSALELKYGQSYLALAKLYFKDFSQVSSTTYMTYIVCSHKMIMSFSPLKVSVMTLKRSYLFIANRLHLLLFNGNYRKHVIKKIFLSKKH